MKNCAVTGCLNNNRDQPDKHFFYVPTMKDPIRRNVWINATRKTFTDKAKFVICEDHFNMQDDVEYYTLNENRPHLKSTSVPHLNLPINHQGEECSSTTLKISDVACQTDFQIETCEVACETDFQIKTCDVACQTDMQIQTCDVGCETDFEVVASASIIDSSTSITDSSGSCFVPSTEDAESSESSSSDESEEESNSDGFEEEDNELLPPFDDDSCDKQVKWTIELMERNIQHYTGIPAQSLELIQFIEKNSTCSRRNIFLILRKIRHNESFVILGDSFGVSSQHAARIFRTQVGKIAGCLRAFIYWPSARSIKWNLPLQFKDKYKNVQAIIDCFEIAIAKPSNPLNQALTWSAYKHFNTIKYLIGSTPDGFISFISKGYTGRITDTEIVKRSGFLDKIDKDMEILADRGFKEIGSDIVSKGGILLKPPSTEAGKIYTEAEAKLCKSIAAVRIHVERVISKLRHFNFLKPNHSYVDHKRTYLIEHSIIIASAICNVQGLLTKI